MQMYIGKQRRDVAILLFHWQKKKWWEGEEAESYWEGRLKLTQKNLKKSAGSVAEF